MWRRRFLAGGAALTAAALAGCTDGGGEQASLDERPPENRVRDALRTAVGEFNTVAAELRFAREDAESYGDFEIDPESPRARIERGRAALDEVTGTEAAADYEAAIAEVRAYGDVVAGLLEGAVQASEASSGLDEVEAAVEARDYETASTTLEGLRSSVGTVLETVSAAVETADGLDTELLSEYGAVVEEVTDALDRVHQGLIGADHLTAGYADLFDGVERVQDVRSQVADDAFEEASSSLSAATESFSAATERFETGREEAPEQLQPQFDAALARSRSLADLAGGYEPIIAGRRHVGDARDAMEAEDLAAADASIDDAADAFASATSRFEDGREGAPEELRGEFDVALDRSRSLEDLAGGYDPLIDGIGAMDDAQAAFDEDDFGGASSSVDAAAEDFGTATSRFESGRADAPDALVGQFDAALARSRALETLADGYGALVTGGERLSDARTAFEDGDFGEAESAATDAEEQFATATGRFEDGRDGAPDSLDARFEAALCRSRNLGDAAGHFAAAAAAAADGDRQTAEQERQNGEDAIEAAGDCA